MVNHLKNNIIRILFILGIFLFSTSLILPLNLRNIPTFIFAFIIAVLIPFFKDLKVFKSKLLVVNTLFFFVMLISLSYSSDIDFGSTRILVLVPLLVMPIGFYLVRVKLISITKKQLHLFYLSFFAATILFLVGIFVHNYINGYLTRTIFIHYPTRMDIGYGKYSMHPIYMSLYVSIAMILSIPLIQKTKNKKNQVLIIIGALFLALILLMLARKGPIIITFLIFTFHSFKKRRHLKYNLILGLGLTLSFLLAYNIDPLRERFFELWAAIFNNNNVLFGSTSMRIHIFDCAFENIIKQPLFGYGIGDVKTVLDYCFSENNNIFKGKYYNSHNQYLSSWLASGIFGLISLLAMLFYNLKNALINKNLVGSTIIILFISVMFTENILERQDGVLLFSFFINFFAFTSVNKN
ncbi:O-antigen ligase family protein [Flavobacteriaceae bacterium]|nr:O-antigen ligase family protein [Flavobacteriaceae bacterium]